MPSRFRLRSVAWRGFVLALGLASGCAAPEEPDGGLARALFPGLALPPLEGHAVVDGPPGDILFVVVDALRPDHMGVYGYPRPTTPFLDLLAQDGHVFLHHSVGAPWTLASTATLLTGLEPEAHGCERTRCRLPAGLTTVAEDLAARGYRTGAVVANLNASSVMGFDRGFESFIDGVRDPGLGKAPTAENALARASRWLDAGQGDPRPWFLFVFLIDPHAPYAAPGEGAWLDGVEGEPVRMPDIAGDYDAAARRGMIASYDAAIAYADAQLEAFFARHEAELADADVLVTADHGEAFGEHGFYRHNYQLWNEFVHVPLIVRTRRWEGRGAAYSLTRAIDLRPTILALAGGTPDASLPGHDLGTWLARPEARSRTGYSRFRDFGDHRATLFDLRYRVILERPDTGPARKRARASAHLPASVARETLRVYDRRADPDEQEDLAPDRIPADAQPLVAALRQRIEGVPRRGAAGRPVSPEVAEQLQALGYADPDAPEDSASPE